MSENDPIKVTDRRGAFRALGAVAAGVTALTVLDAQVASAANGGGLLLGATNDATSTTTLGSASEPDQVLFVNTDYQWISAVPASDWVELFDVLATAEHARVGGGAPRGRTRPVARRA